jgi:MOSC domain-containing protein YiiM
MANLRHLFRAVIRRLPRQELSEARLLNAFGVEGCAHAKRSGKRQVLLVDRESLEAMQLAPGTIRENITAEGLAVGSLEIGQQFGVGETLLEVSAVCTPCDQLEKIRPRLRREIGGRRGMLCHMLKGGWLRTGDPIDTVEQTQERQSIPS